jgi:hypothetical protein
MPVILSGSVREAEAGGSGVQGQLGSTAKTLSQKKKKDKLNFI